MKLMDMSWHYFRHLSNVFDFFLVILGFVGLGLAYGMDTTWAFSEAKTIRLLRLFRTLRFLRTFRLYHALKSGRGHGVQELAGHMQKMTILDSYICAHTHAQKALADFFGQSWEIECAIDDSGQPEIARCICQSQICVYEAARNRVQERRGLDPAIQRQFDMELREKVITERLHNFVMTAMKDGALTAREAEAMLHPLQHMLQQCQGRLNQLEDGIVADDTDADESISDDDKAQGDEIREPSGEPFPVVDVSFV